MNMNVMLLPIVMPFLSGLSILAVLRSSRMVKQAIALFAATLNLWIVLSIFKWRLSYSLPWAGYGLEFSLKLYHFSAFIMAAAACFGFLVILYSMAFMRR